MDPIVWFRPQAGFDPATARAKGEKPFMRQGHEILCRESVSGSVVLYYCLDQV